MAFSPEEQQIITFGKAKGKSRDEVLKAIEAYRTSQASTTSPTETAKPLQTIGGAIQGAGDKMYAAVTGQGDFANKSALERGISATASSFSAIPAVATAALPDVIQKPVERAGAAIGSGFSKFTELLGSIPALQKWTQENPEATDGIMRALQATADVGTIAGTIAGAKGATKTLESGTAAAAGAAIRSTQKLVDGTTSLVKSTGKVGNILTPKKDAPGAMGEVLQGKPGDVAKGLEAFKAIDTTDVKTYAELSKRIDTSIGNLSDVVDGELSKDLTRTPLSNLSTSLKTKSGNTVTTNYVQTALEQMKELYTKTGDVKKAADIDELIENAQSTGLTKLEVNDIARVYNSEFGSKAFSALGEPLTSVNAQLYETIRKGVKAKAREGIGGVEAKAADQTISALYNTKTLVQKNAEAVNKLQQKIAERGLFEKAGYLVSKYADIVTGGSIRGFVGGILPRGAGYKTLNAIDLEARLQRNLEIIEKASKATTDAEMTKILAELEQ